MILLYIVYIDVNSLLSHYAIYRKSMYIAAFKNLYVWQKSVELVKDIYKLVQLLPQYELYGLVSQMRRSSLSIPCNIAEGKRRKTRKEFLQFLRIADGSAAELETQIYIARQVYSDIDFSKTSALLEEVQKMLMVLIKKVPPSNLI